MSYTVRSLLIFLASVLFTFVYVSTVQAAVIQMDREEIIQRSKLILVGTILDKIPRWNQKKNLIVTDYHLKVDEVLFGKAKTEITLTFAGGFLPGEGGHRVSGVPSFTVGEQVLLMLDSHDKPSFSPVTGIYQGSFSAKDFRIRSNRTFQNFIDIMKQEIPNAKNNPLPDRSVPSILRQLNRKKSSNSGEIAHNFIYQGKKQSTPIVFYSLPEKYPFSPHDQYQMKYWNKYADIFQIRTKSDNKWGWKNGRNEIAGFLNSEEMKDIFGYPWDENMLAITWVRYNDSKIVEADIAFNKNINWTIDGFSTYWNYNLINFNDTCLHELGHAWGLDHNFNEISVMNYMPHKYAAYERLYGDDIMAIRQAFPSNVIPRTDLGVHLYYSYGDKRVLDAYVNLNYDGSSLTVNNYIIENVGTNTQSSPKIEWYLTPKIHSWDNAISLGVITYNSLDPNSYISKVPQTLNIPSNLPHGIYYLGARVRLEGDSVEKNNSSWLDYPITILPKFVGNLSYSSNSAVQHVFMRDENNQLRELWWTLDFIRLENLSAAVDGQTIAGDPVYYREDNGTQHIFVVDTNNHLREWWWTHKTGWKLEDLGIAVGKPAYFNDNGVQHIFARDTNGHLREWRWTADSGWHLEDLSLVVGGQTIVSDPVYFNDNGVQHVFAIDSNGHLREWWWTSDNGWRLENLSVAVGGQTVTGQLSYFNENGVQHIFARDTNGHLREWWWTSDTGWRLEDLSIAVGGQTIAGNPVYFNDNGVQHVFVRDTNNHLREWWWTAKTGWKLEDLSIAVGGQTIANDPVYHNNNGVQKLFVIDLEGKLRQWRWIAEIGWIMFLM